MSHRWVVRILVVAVVAGGGLGAQSATADAAQDRPPAAGTVNTPVVPLPVTLVTPLPLISGSAFVVVTLYTTPRSVMVAPPSLVTLPPSVAAVPVMLALVGVVTVGEARRVTVTV